MHQLVEYVLGAVLLMSALRNPTPAVPAVIGGLIMAHAAFTKGPIAAFQAIHRRVHRWIDVGLIAVEVAAAVQPWFSIEATGRLLLGAIAFVHAFVWWNSSFATRATRRERRARRPAVADEDRSTELGRRAGRMVGKGINAAKRSRAAGDDSAAG